MRDEVRRINKLVADGKISPEDAADLIDAFYAADREDQAEGASTGAATPPPPPGSPTRDPFKGIIDQIERLTKEGVDSVDWKEVSNQARESAKKGLDFLRTGIEDISKGKLNLNLFGTVETKDISLPLNVPEGKTLKIENACGDVRVSGGADSGTATAKAKFRGSTLEEARNKAQQYTLIIEESEHQVIIRQPDVVGLVVDLDIRFAGSAPVEVKTQSGDIHLHETGGSGRVNARSGDIHVRGLNGTIEIHSESGDIAVESSETSGLTIENKAGDIRIEGVRGNMNIRTATGDLHAKTSSGKVMALESISGDVSIDLDVPISGSLSVRTVNGDATIALPDGNDCRVSLATLRGTVKCGVPLEDEASQQQRITGKLGEGNGTLDVSAVTGDVSVEMRMTESAAV